MEVVSSHVANVARHRSWPKVPKPLIRHTHTGSTPTPLADKLALNAEDLLELEKLWAHLHSLYCPGEAPQNYKEACEVELRKYAADHFITTPVGQVLDSFTYFMMLNVVPFFMFMRGMHNFAGPGKPYTHPGGQLFPFKVRLLPGSRYILGDGANSGPTDGMLRASGLDYIHGLNYYTLRSISVRFEASPGHEIALPMNLDYIPGFFNMSSIKVYDATRSGTRDELQGNYQGKDASRQVNRNMFEYFQKFPTMLNVAFMQCAPENYSDIHFYTKYAMLIRGQVCYFRAREENCEQEPYGAPKHYYAKRRTRFNALGAEAGDCPVYGPTPENQKSQYNMAGQKWILECESKPEQEVTLAQRMPMLIRNWGWKPFAEMDILEPVAQPFDVVSFPFGLGTETENLRYMSVHDCHVASKFRNRVYKFSIAGRKLATNLKRLSVQVLLLIMFVCAMAYFLYVMVARA